MTTLEFTDICKNIFEQAGKSLPVGYRTQIEHDEMATSDKGKRPTLMFAAWGKPKQQFWYRGFCSYSIVHDPQKKIEEAVPFQVRFVYFHSREECGSGRFNAQVLPLLKSLDGQRGFIFSQNHKTYRIYRPYPNLECSPEWQAAAADDLGWLLTATFPQLSQMLAASASA